MRNLLSEVGDAAIEEIMDIPQLVKMGVEVASDKEKAKALWNSVKGINLDKIKGAASGAIKDKWNKYADSPSYVTYHEMGKDGVQVASMIYGGFLKKGKKLLEATEETEEILRKNADEVGDEIKKVDGDKIEEVTEIVGKYNWELVRKYFRHIQEVTGRAVPKKQIDKLKDALRAKEYKLLSTAELDAHRLDFNKRRDNIIADWERETGEKWPTYKEIVYDKNGEVYKRIGDKYDAHHIIENKFGGDNEWWNMHPAKSPSEHQGGIHGSGSPSKELFK